MAVRAFGMGQYEFGTSKLENWKISSIMMVPVIHSQLIRRQPHLQLHIVSITGNLAQMTFRCGQFMIKNKWRTKTRTATRLILDSIELTSQLRLDVTMAKLIKLHCKNNQNLNIVEFKVNCSA